MFMFFISRHGFLMAHDNCTHHTSFKLNMLTLLVYLLSVTHGTVVQNQLHFNFKKELIELIELIILQVFE